MLVRLAQRRRQMHELTDLIGNGGGVGFGWDWGWVRVGGCVGFGCGCGWAGLGLGWVWWVGLVACHVILFDFSRAGDAVHLGVLSQVEGIPSRAQDFGQVNTICELRTLRVVALDAHNNIVTTLRSVR